MSKRKFTKQELKIIASLIDELDDAVSFMETLTDYEDEEGEKRRVDKAKLVTRACRLFEPYFKELEKE